MTSERQSELDALDAIRDILTPLDDDDREEVLATIVMWWVAHHDDRVEAITRLYDRIAELEEDIAMEEMSQKWVTC